MPRPLPEKPGSIFSLRRLLGASSETLRKLPESQHLLIARFELNALKRIAEKPFQKLPKWLVAQIERKAQTGEPVSFQSPKLEVNFYKMPAGFVVSSLEGNVSQLYDRQGIPFRKRAGYERRKKQAEPVFAAGSKIGEEKTLYRGKSGKLLPDRRFEQRRAEKRERRSIGNEIRSKQESRQNPGKRRRFTDR
ncbi:MAG: hypothetical protein J4478_05150 [Candidatus Diapherotrites archaeon]|uniref:Uncharacterized protein n=1 Tax=Candidatus Iainarchaeum sp. TaxID=3101447 RepID=A0A8T4KUK0_9ARCH|nr:hypothetical protein [Candidatus Diapherotrites archaeon]